MTTIGELIDELNRFPRQARVSVCVGIEAASMQVCTHEDANYSPDAVQPIGCNTMDVQILLWSEI